MNRFKDWLAGGWGDEPELYAKWDWIALLMLVVIVFSALVGIAGITLMLLP